MDALHRMLVYSSLDAIQQVALSCKALHAAVTHDNLWQLLCHRQSVLCSPYCTGTWQQLFRSPPFIYDLSVAEDAAVSPTNPTPSPDDAPDSEHTPDRASQHGTRKDATTQLGVHPRREPAIKPRNSRPLSLAQAREGQEKHAEPARYQRARSNTQCTEKAMKAV